MPRVKRGTVTHRRHAAVLERASGFRTGRSTQFRRASEALLKADQFAYRDRRTKKRDLRRGWIVRINAAVREHGLSYGRFIDGLTKAGIEVDRKVMSEMAISQPEAFGSLVAASKKALSYLKDAGTTNEFESAVK